MLLCYVMLCYVTLRYVTLRYVTLRYVTLRYVLFCSVLFCSVLLRYVTLRYVMLYYILHIAVARLVIASDRFPVGNGFDSINNDNDSIITMCDPKVVNTIYVFLTRVFFLHSGHVTSYASLCQFSAVTSCSRHSLQYVC